MRKILQYILRTLSRLILSRHKPFIVAVTGSVGKSSTKEAIFCVLNKYFPGDVRKNERNLNTEIGVPVTIIGGRDAKRNIFIWAFNFLKAFKVAIFSGTYPKYLVLELAADRPGDLVWLTSFIKPDISVVTAIGDMPVHLEFFPTRGDYIKEKSQILKSLKPAGIAVLNQDDPAVAQMKKILPKDRKVITYGYGKDADLVFSNITHNIPSSSKDIESLVLNFKITHDGKTIPVKVKDALGEGVARASAAATAVSLSLGINLINIAKALGTFNTPKGRLNLIKGIKDTIIIDDTYNSSPLSAEIAMSVLGNFKSSRRIAVLGDMLELGRNTEVAHRKIAVSIAEAADIVFLVGGAVVFTREELIGRGFREGEDLFYFESSDKAKIRVQEEIEEYDVILVKGSQSIRAEKIVKEIMAEPEKAKELLVRQYGHWLKS